MLKSVQSDEVLVVRILSDLVNKSTIRKAHPLLQDQGAKYHSSRLGDIACSGWKHCLLESFPCLPRQLFSEFDPFIVLIQLHSASGIEIGETELLIVIISGFVHGKMPQSAS